MYRIGGSYHISHCVADLGVADEWYRKVLGAHLIRKDYVAEALRDASFWVIADYVWEVVCPADRPGADAAPMGRFVRRYGPRLHSFSWWVDDPSACAATLNEAGIRVVDVAGAPVQPDEVGRDAALFTHPRDSHGMLEFAGPECTPEMLMPIDGVPLAAHWRDEHPLGITRISHSTVVVADLDGVSDLYARALSARPCDRRMADESQSIFLRVGTTCLELRAPLHPDGRTGRWLAANGEGSHSVAFEVADLARTQTHLESLGCTVTQVGDETIAMDPAFGLNVAYEFTTRGPLRAA